MISLDASSKQGRCTGEIIALLYVVMLHPAQPRTSLEERRPLSCEHLFLCASQFVNSCLSTWSLTSTPILREVDTGREKPTTLGVIRSWSEDEDKDFKWISTGCERAHTLQTSNHTKMTREKQKHGLVDFDIEKT